MCKSDQKQRQICKIMICIIVQLHISLKVRRLCTFLLITFKISVKITIGVGDTKSSIDWGTVRQKGHVSSSQIKNVFKVLLPNKAPGPECIMGEAFRACCTVLQLVGLLKCEFLETWHLSYLSYMHTARLDIEQTLSKYLLNKWINQWRPTTTHIDFKRLLDGYCQSLHQWHCIFLHHPRLRKSSFCLEHISKSQPAWSFLLCLFSSQSQRVLW